MKHHIRLSRAHKLSKHCQKNMFSLQPTHLVSLYIPLSAFSNARFIPCPTSCSCKHWLKHCQKTWFLFNVSACPSSQSLYTFVCIFPCKIEPGFELGLYLVGNPTQHIYLGYPQQIAFETFSPFFQISLCKIYIEYQCDPYIFISLD